MNKNHTRWVVALLLLGVGLLILAGPGSDWLIGKFKKPESDVLATAPKMSQTTLPILRLHQDTLKVPDKAPDVETEPEAKPTVPPATSPNTGILNNDEIESVMNAHESLFQRCWAQRLKEKPDLRGQVLLQFEISSRGRVQNIQLLDSQLHDETMEGCLMSVLERISFREFSGGPVTLTFPLAFQ